MFWPSQCMLIIADAHFGKVMHFRKAGIPIPTKIILDDFKRLENLIKTWKPKRVLFLGDLFHSALNSEWHLLETFIEKYAALSFELILGNHDVYAESAFLKLMKVYPEKLDLFPFCLSHIPLELVDIPAGFYNLSGHIHPAVRMVGNGKQRLQFPCFFFGKQQGLLPAFGGFTGNAKINIKQDDVVFPIVDGKVMKV